MKDIIKGDAPEQVGAKRKKRRSKKNLSLYYTLVLLLVTIVGVILSLTVLFKTDKIIVVGDVPYNEADIIEASGIVTGENIIRANYSDAEDRIINTLLYVETAQVKKKFPTTVVITVTETKPCYNISTEDGYLIVSESGKVLDLLVSPIDGLLTVYGIKPISLEPFSRLEDKETDKADILFQISKAIEKSKIEGIASVDLDDKYDIKLDFEERIEVQIGNSSNIDYKISYVKSVFESNKIGSSTKGFLMIDEDGEGHFVSEESMKQYEDHAQENSDSNESDPSDNESGVYDVSDDESDDESNSESLNDSE